LEPAAATGFVAGSNNYRRAIGALCAAGVATFGQLYYPQGILPVIGDDLHASPATAALTISGSTLGLGVAVLGWSRVADRIGRVQAMRIALLAALTIGFLALLSPALPVLVALRTLQGIALGGVPALALTYLGDEVHRAYVGMAAGTFIAGTAVGGLVGRLVAAPIADVAGWRLGAATAQLVAAAATAVFVALIPRARSVGRPTGVGRGSLRRAVVANLRSWPMVVLLSQALLLMGGYVAVYNYLGYRLQAPPFDLPVSTTSLIFLAALSGTFSARWASKLGRRRGRGPVLMGGAVLMAAGSAMTLVNWLPSVLVGLVLLTAAFFGAHAIASGWVTQRATVGRAQAASLYSFFYYAGSSLFGWIGGLAFRAGWSGTAVMVGGLALVACALVATQPELRQLTPTSTPGSITRAARARGRRRTRRRTHDGLRREC